MERRLRLIGAEAALPFCFVKIFEEEIWYS